MTGEEHGHAMTPQQEDLLVAFAHAIFAERVRAHVKHGDTSMESAPLLHHRRASILAEEAVECARALNDYELGDITLYEDMRTLRVDQSPRVNDELDKELIQTAAMAFTWWANRRGDRLAPAADGSRRVAGIALHSAAEGELVEIRLLNEDAV